jgi:hypothetical protein
LAIQTIIAINPAISAAIPNVAAVQNAIQLIVPTFTTAVCVATAIVLADVAAVDNHVATIPFSFTILLRIQYLKPDITVLF